MQNHILAYIRIFVAIEMLLSLFRSSLHTALSEFFGPAESCLSPKVVFFMGS